MLLAAALGLQDFRHFVAGGVGGVPLVVAGNGEGGIAHIDFGHAVWAACGGVGLLAWGVGHRHSCMKKGPTEVEAKKLFEILRSADGNVCDNMIYL